MRRFTEVHIGVKLAPILMIALVLEVLQLATTTRVFELTDIVAGALGSVFIGHYNSYLGENWTSCLRN